MSRPCRTVIRISKNGTTAPDGITLGALGVFAGLGLTDVESILDDKSSYTIFFQGKTVAVNVGYIRAAITENQVMIVTDGYDGVNPDVLPEASMVDPITGASKKLSSFVKKMAYRFMTVHVNKENLPMPLEQQIPIWHEEAKIWKQHDPDKSFQCIALDACLQEVLRMLKDECVKLEEELTPAKAVGTTELNKAQFTQRCMRRLKLRIEMVHDAIIDMIKMKDDSVQLPRELHDDVFKLLNDYVRPVKLLLNRNSTMLLSADFVVEVIQHRMDRVRKVADDMLFYMGITGASLGWVGAGGGLWGMNLALPKGMTENYSGKWFFGMMAGLVGTGAVGGYITTRRFGQMKKKAAEGAADSAKEENEETQQYQG